MTWTKNKTMLVVVLAVLLSVVATTERLRQKKTHRTRPRQGQGPIEPIVGIGAMLGIDPQTHEIKIMGTVSNSPAAMAGLTGGLIIQKIDDQDMAGKKLKDCVDLIRGPAGTEVHLQLVDPAKNETNDCKLIRQKIKL